MHVISILSFSHNIPTNSATILIILTLYHTFPTFNNPREMLEETMPITSLSPFPAVFSVLSDSYQVTCKILLLFTTQSQVLTTLRNQPFENKSARNQHFLLLPQCFLLYKRQVSYFYPCQVYRLQILSIWTSLNFVVW